MQKQITLPAFDDFCHLFIRTNPLTPPEQLHGVLSGLVCMEQKIKGGPSWLDIILTRYCSHGATSQKHQSMLLSLYDTTCRQLHGAGEFQLLLPSESKGLFERAKAVSAWCQGFLYGLMFVENPISEETPEVVFESLRCINEIAKLNFERIEVTDTDLLAYEGMIEFIKNTVPLIYNAYVDCSAERIYLH